MSINSSSISPVIYLLFIFSFTVLFTIAKHAILSPEDGSPFQTTCKPFYLFFVPDVIESGDGPHGIPGECLVGWDTLLLLQDYHLLWFTFSKVLVLVFVPG
jgi:hypothetical protein